MTITLCGLIPVAALDLLTPLDAPALISISLVSISLSMGVVLAPGKHQAARQEGNREVDPKNRTRGKR